MISTTKNKSKIRLWAIIFWIIVWYLASLIIDNKVVLVSPVEVMIELSKLVLTADFWLSISMSMLKIAGGFFLAVIIGIMLAVLSGKYIRVRELLAPFIATIKTIPVASFIILVLVWLSSNQLAIFISFIMVLPIIYTNVINGIDQIDPKLNEMADVFQLKSWSRVRHIYLSQVIPYLKSGISLAIGMCWKAGVAAEVIGLPQKSIGEHLYEAKVFLDTAGLFAWTFVIICISVLFEKTFMALFNKGLSKLESGA